jgi:hypothetical protein
MESLTIALAGLSLAAVAWYAWRRSRSVSSVALRGYLLRYTDLEGWRAIPAVVTHAGLVADGVTYPVPARVQVGPVTVWILLVDAPALATHEALERAREAAALSSLWVGGGQWIDFLRLLGVLLPAALSIVVWQQVNNLAALVAALLEAR